MLPSSFDTAPLVLGGKTSLSLIPSSSRRRWEGNSGTTQGCLSCSSSISSSPRAPDCVKTHLSLDEWGEVAKRREEKMCSLLDAEIRYKVGRLPYTAHDFGLFTQSRSRWTTVQRLQQHLDLWIS